MQAMILTRNILLLLVAGFLLFTSSSCKEEKIADIGFFDENVLSVSTFLEKNKEEYSKYWQIVEKTDLFATLNAYNPFGDGYTLFLPTDAAFDRYIELHKDKYSNFESLLADQEFVNLLGRYHIVNRSMRTTDFPFGALPDTTATGDFLTVGIEVDGDSSFYKINSTAPLVIYDIETTNGYIQVIDEVLEPISFSSYEWLDNMKGYSILAQAFEYSGLKDTMGITRYSSTGKIIKNSYTVLAEHDSIFNRNGIFTFEDLVAKYHTPGYALNDPDGGLYQFAAYHLLEGRYFLDDFSGSSNYNTYALYPVSITAGLDIRINTGVDSFGVVTSGTQPLIINYIGLFYNESNVNTKNGPIHLIDQIMELFEPARSSRTFQFMEDPVINKSSKTEGTYEFVDLNLFEYIWWSGPENLTYVKGTTGSNKANNLDYIEIQDNFKFSYIMPKIMPGKYTVKLKLEAYGSNNATIRIWIDGKKMGGNLSLTSGGTSGNPYVVFTVGTVEFTSYKEHILEINSLIPGTMKIDFVQFIVQ